MTESFNKIVPSNRSGKKYMIVLRKGGKKIKTIHFGQAGASDFTQHKDEERRKRYMDRHRATENWNDEKTAGFYAYHILWRFKTLNEAKSWLSTHLKSKGYS